MMYHSGEVGKLPEVTGFGEFPFSSKLYSALPILFGHIDQNIIFWTWEIQK